MARAEFIDQIAPLIQRYAPEYDIRACSAVIAQAILESGWGESTLAAKYHNYFGMKCGTKWTGASVNMTTQEEYSPGTLTTISDNFRVFDSMEAGVRGYFEFLQLARYQNLRGITDPRTYLQTIKDDGYATSSSYVANCMELVEQYGLTKYDEGESMAITISQASHDERGQYTGGTAGNQSDELNTRALWDNGWQTLITWNDAAKGKACATAALQAVGNKHIGYDQYERNTILTYAEAAGYNLAAITTDCECDCTSLASVCAIAAGAPKSIMFEGGNLAYTGNIADRLKRTGLVTIQNGLSYSQIQAKASTGAIIVSSGHAVIVTSGASATSSAPTVATANIDQLAKDVIDGKYGNGDQRKVALGSNYEAVQKRVNEMMGGGSAPAATKSVEEIAREVIHGDWGNGKDRKERLTAAGYNYTAVQQKVNELLR